MRSNRNRLAATAMLTHCEFACPVDVALNIVTAVASVDSKATLQIHCCPWHQIP